MDAHYSKHAAELKAAKGKVEEKWNRRGRSPLKFVESFDELEDLVSYHESSLKEPDAEGIPEEFISFIRKMREFLESRRPDYKAKLHFANAQRAKNEYWRDRFDPPVRPLQGGRADGNRG